jgi:hypothetical protein
MPNPTDRRRNIASWWGLLFAIGAVGCNAAFLVQPSFQGALPWLSLLFGIFSVIFLVTGLKRAYGQPQIYRGRILSVVLTLVALAPLGLTAFAFVKAHKLPDSTAAPQVGQRVPDFTLADTSGTPVSLDQLFAPSMGSSSGPSSATLSATQAPAPKAVLLIFYRGYW